MLNPESPLYPFVQNRKVVVLSESNRADEAAKAMRDQRIGAVVVADDDGHMTGMVTDRDLVCEVMATDSGAETPLSEFMSPELCGVTEEATLSDVICVMVDNCVRRVPILREISNGRSRCMGIITLDDLMAQKAIDTASLACIVGSQVRAFASPQARPPARKLRRMEQTLIMFSKNVARETGVDEADALNLAQTILSFIVRRITSREAAQLITQLPHLMQDELLDQEAGPDRSINAEMILQSVAAELHGSRDPREVCRGFWKALRESISPGELHDVRSQLPKDLQELFVPPHSDETLRKTA